MPDAPNFILTKVIATLGPASLDPKILVRLIEEGARVFRINFSHGTFDNFFTSLQAVRRASEETGIHVGVLGDLSGPKIRIGKVRDGGIMIDVGQTIEFQRTPIVAGLEGTPLVEGAAVFSTTQPTLIDDVQVGHRLLIDDGNVRALVIDKPPAPGDPDRRLVCRVTVGGLVTSAKGVNLPDSNLRVPSLTDWDRQCVDWAIEHDVDFLALSFVRKAEDLRQLKLVLAERRGAGDVPLPVIAKIEKPQALDDLEDIVNEADGLMVARGDLGVEMDLAQVPVIQKRIIRMSHDYGKPVIVATQMLQSMIESAVPTRAEVSDVANAILDGADAVMLSGETAVGKFPVQAVHFMAHIADTTQDMMAQERSQAAPAPPRMLQESRYRTAALAHGVNVIVRDLGAKLIFVWSQNGGGARYLSQNRPDVPIIAASSSPQALRHMSLLYGVIPVQMTPPSNNNQFVDEVDQMVLRHNWATRGEAIVVVTGQPLGLAGSTNALRIHRVGSTAI